MNEQMVKGASAPNGDFALGFQPDGVQLLHRHDSAWAELGKVLFKGDLRRGLSDFIQQLRAANAPDLLLVIPDAQILYTDLVLPAAADTEAALQLEGTAELGRDLELLDFVPGDRAIFATVLQRDD